MTSADEYNLDPVDEWADAPDEAPVTSRAASRASMVMIYAVLLVISTIGAAIAPSEMSAGYMIVPVLLATAIVVLQIVHYATGPKPINWITADMVFLILFYIIHYVIPIYYILGMVDESQRVWINPEIVNFSTMMSISGLCAFYIGFHGLAERHNRIRVPRYIDDYCLQRWRAVGRVIFFLASAGSCVYLVTVGRALTEGMYTGQLGGLGTRMILLLFSILLYTSIAILSVTAGLQSGKWKIGFVVKVMFCVFVLGSVLLGDRSLTMLACLAAAAGFSEYAKPFSFKKLVIGMMAGMMLMGFVRVVRQSADRTPWGLVRYAVANPEATEWDQGLINLAGSAKTLYAAVHFVPDQYPHFNGRLKLSGLAGIVPFSRRVFVVRRIEYTSSALFLTYVINKGDFTSGAGSSIIADCYLAFGYPGVVGLMLLLGLLCKQIQQKARASGTMGWGVAHVVLIPWMAMMARNELTSLVRGVLWPVLIVWVMSSLLGVSRNPALDYDPGYDDEYDEYDEYADGDDDGEREAVPDYSPAEAT